MSTDTRLRDGYRRFQGERYIAAYGGNRKALAHATNVSRQAIDRHARGEAQTISYADLAKLAATPGGNPETVPLGALEVIASVRANGDVFSLAQQADEWMGRAQAHDGNEDCAQLSVKACLAAFAFMDDNRTLPFRTNAIAALEKWRACKRAEMAADLAALGYVDALISKLSPTGER